jgi:hypothetical protein
VVVVLTFDQHTQLCDHTLARTFYYSLYYYTTVYSGQPRVTVKINQADCPNHTPHPPTNKPLHFFLQTTTTMPAE